LKFNINVDPGVKVNSSPSASDVDLNPINNSSVDDKLDTVRFSTKFPIDHPSISLSLTISAAVSAIVTVLANGHLVT
jgi:hypothetical protein